MRDRTIRGRKVQGVVALVTLLNEIMPWDPCPRVIVSRQAVAEGLEPEFTVLWYDGEIDE
jgi:hypothetical protein